MQTRLHAAKGCVAAALLFSVVVPVSAIAVPLAAATVNCVSSTCSLYSDLSGNASANLLGGDSFSYQPSWVSTNSLYVQDSASSTQNNAAALATLASFATFGALKSVLTSSATGSGTASLPHATSVTSSRIAFQDRLTFTGAPANTLGTMTGRLSFSGNVSALASSTNSSLSYGYATANASVNGPGQSINVFDRSDDANPPVSPNQFLTFTAAVRFGAIDFTSLFVELFTTAQSLGLSGLGSSYWGMSEADFFSSLEWEGIDSVTDLQGNVITGWDVTSASGFDYARSYAQQVPEPGTWVLMLSGLGLVGWVARRRKQAEV